MDAKKPYPNDSTKKKIEAFFLTPIPDKVRNEVVECQGGFILQEVRPHWQRQGEFTRHLFAKMVYVSKTDEWKVYWQRANGDWNLLHMLKTLDEVLVFINSNPNGCFFG